MKARIQTVEVLKKFGFPDSTIAKEFEVSRQTIWRDTKRIEEGQAAKQQEKKNKRKATVLTPANVAAAKTLFKSKANMSKRKVAPALRPQGVQMSASTALKAAKLANLRKYSLKRKPPLKPDHIYHQKKKIRNKAR